MRLHTEMSEGIVVTESDARGVDDTVGSVVAEAPVVEDVELDDAVVEEDGEPVNSGQRPDAAALSLVIITLKSESIHILGSACEPSDSM